MKLSLNWIKEYVDLPQDLEAVQIAHDLTLSTVEVEGFDNVADNLQGVVVAEIKEVLPHPNADALRITRCDLGSGQIKDIVCGGSNLEVGMKVAVAVPGAMVRWHGEGDLVEIKAAKLRGVESYGMICGADEIGLEELFPPQSEKEIVDLSSIDTDNGVFVADALGLDDIILEIDNKSLTNRPDLWSHYGMAREMAAIYGLDLKPLELVDAPSAHGGIAVDIHAREYCSRYTATRVEGVEGAAVSPLWLRRRLALVGQRPINLLVDLTNYVMMAVGQPSHAFDAVKVSGNLQVRMAKAEECFEMLDASTPELLPESVVIADDKQGLALAGVVGGQASSVTDSTDTMLLEVANFKGLQVRQDSGRYGIRTESSSRFEKDLDPENVMTGLRLLLTLLQQTQPQAKVTGFCDDYPVPLEQAKVDISLAFLHSRLGKALTVEEITDYLNRLGFEVSESNGDFSVVAPTWRSTGDISLQEDIVEEVARLHGYDHFNFVPPVVSLTAAIHQPKPQLERKLKSFLAHEGGMQEVVSYPWVEDSYIQAAGLDDVPALTLFAPPSPETKRVQTSLVPQILKTVASNTRFSHDFRVFEVNRVFQVERQAEADNGEQLPVQPKYAVGALVGQDAGELFLQAKGLISRLSESLQMASIEFTTESDAPWADKHGQLGLLVNGKPAGTLAAVSSRTMRLADIKFCNCILFELNLDELEPNVSRENGYTRLPEVPPVDYDLSFLCDLSTQWQQIVSAVEGSDELIRDVVFVDEYRGEQVPEGKKSITLRLFIGDQVGTLKSKRIEEAASKAKDQLKDKVGIEMRDGA